jgi:hypothetical protein
MDQYLLFVLILCPDSIRESSNMAYLEKTSVLDTKLPRYFKKCPAAPSPGSSRGYLRRVNGDWACDFLAIDT